MKLNLCLSPTKVRKTSNPQIVLEQYPINSLPVHSIARSNEILCCETVNYYAFLKRRLIGAS
jgi:hypothetical protein